MWSARRLKSLRNQRGVTQAALGRAAGCTRVTIARLETGTRRPSVGLLCRLAVALKVDIELLLKGRTR